MSLKTTIREILVDYGDRIVEAMVQAMRDDNRIGTGDTMNNISFTVENDNELMIHAPEHIFNLEEGRQPTGGDTGGGGFFEQIQRWALARGIDEEFHYAIYKSVNMFGYTGTEGLFSNPVNQLLQEMAQEIEEKTEIKIQEDILKIFQDR